MCGVCICSSVAADVLQYVSNALRTYIIRCMLMLSSVRTAYTAQSKCAACIAQSKMQSMPSAECMFCFSVLQAALDSMHAARLSDAHQLEMAFEEQQVLLMDCHFLFILVFTMHMKLCQNKTMHVCAS